MLGDDLQRAELSPGQQVDVQEVAGALNLVFMSTPITHSYRNPWQYHPACLPQAGAARSQSKERAELALCLQVDVEEVSGALNLVFMGTTITNAYRNLTNIILRVSPKRALAQPAVLINAHFDSAFGSPGDLCSGTRSSLTYERILLAAQVGLHAAVQLCPCT